ncbi:MAG: hypothetical protein R3F56_01720 [Planctomycetota bacterium]
MKCFAFVLLGILPAVSPGASPAIGQDPAVIPAGYRVERIEVPKGIVLEVGGLGFADDGDLFVCTRIGEVWRRRGETWSIFARGLHEPLGLWVDRRAGHVYVMQRPELTRLVDSDADGRADRYETVCAAWGVSGNYHEYAYGLVRAPDGSFFGTLNLAHAIDDASRQVLVAGGTVMSRPAKWRGWAFRVAPDGTFEPWASGLRSPAGIGANAAGDVFFTDNQGDWIGTSTLQHLVKGAFYGHPASLLDHPDFAGREPSSLKLEDFADRRRMPTVHIPYGDLANSPGDPAFDLTGGRFGPFADQAFVGDQTRSNVFRVCLEKVGGEYQGCCFDFVDHLQSGIVRACFADDGSLYVGETARGWGSAGPAEYGLERVVWDGATKPREMHHVSLRRDGFHVAFTCALPADGLAAANFTVARWHYLYRPEYGSPPQDVTEVAITAVRAAEDGESVDLILPEVVPGQVYRITVDPGLGLGNSRAWYTVNRLVD